MTDSPVLALDRVSVRYPNGGLALENVSLELRHGEAAVVVGPNGAGKTSLARAVAGYLSHENVAVTGNVRLHGRPIQGWQPDRIARSGVVYIPERDKVFSGLTVSENLSLFAARRRNEAGRDEDLEFAYRLFPRLRERLNQQAGYLSGGEQQMLALAGSLVSRPDLMVVDEPCLGLAPIVIQEVMRALRQLRDELGTALLLVDQNAKATVGLADRTYAVSNGRVREEDVATLTGTLTGASAKPTRSALP